ncbi:MAG: thioredoxin domain-containing protein [Myxococcota bacterium]|nr:thioredoxin domain-containing protein [Myxococcota bacterium]
MSTVHVGTDTSDGQGSSRLNRLAAEKSPYLLQHARNPVDWYPWGNAAFERSQQEGKPIFLSIGYATCHWCHVMAQDSFEDLRVAELLNKSFIPVKVDREERPDVDSAYMSACHLMTGGGGWPLTVILTPEKKPFFAATFIPRESHVGRVGMLDLLPRVAYDWQTRRSEITALADRVMAALRAKPQHAAAGMPTDQLLHTAYSELKAAFDPEYGGFGQGMKFPMPHQLIFLLRYWQRTGEGAARDMVVKTLTAMRRGGIYDQLGFGFHRYSVDARWRVPHFEKMLYDQALLLWAYTEAFAVTENDLFEETAREIATYMLRDLASAEGGFYCAEDADSEGEEGKFYLWTEDEIQSHLDPATASITIQAFGVSSAGNYKDEATGKKTGKNILYRRDAYLDKDRATGLQAARQGLLAARQGRERPLLDDKILTDWNGLAIGALAIAARVFHDATYAEAAQKAAQFILSALTDEDGRLVHRYRDGASGLPAHLDDHAFLSFGLLNLFEATGDTTYLSKAAHLTHQMVTRFEDKAEGGFFLTSDDTETVLIRTKETFDGALPSGNAMALYNLVRLAGMTQQPEYKQAAQRTLVFFNTTVARGASAHALFLIGLDAALQVGDIASDPGRNPQE